MGALDTQTFFATVEKYTCASEGCGVVFGLETGFVNYRRNDKKSFFCPNGHSQFFPGKTEAEMLKEELEKQKRRTSWAEDALKSAHEREDRIKAKNSALKGVITKTKKRIAHGVCPCCNRTFEKLARHMANKHPEYQEAK